MQCGVNQSFMCLLPPPVIAFKQSAFPFCFHIREIIVFINKYNLEPFKVKKINYNLFHV